VSDQHPERGTGPASGQVDEPLVHSSTEPVAVPTSADPGDSSPVVKPPPPVTDPRDESPAGDQPPAEDSPRETDSPGADSTDPETADQSNGDEPPALPSSTDPATEPDDAESLVVPGSSDPDSDPDSEPVVEDPAAAPDPVDEADSGEPPAAPGDADPAIEPEPDVADLLDPPGSGGSDGDGSAVAGEVGADDEDVEGGLPPLSDADLDSALEALLLVVDSPVEEEALATALNTTPLRVAEHLRLLSDNYTDHDRGIDLRRAGGGWRFYTRDRYAPYVEKLLLDGQRAKLTRAALETLAVIAYRQPVTRARVAAVRGVNCDGVIRTLLARGLVEETGTDVETGGFLYRTTELFLERLGLSSLEDLPPIAPLLPEVDSIDEV
jgi:segregation and condensation protein B